MKHSVGKKSEMLAFQIFRRLFNDEIFFTRDYAQLYVGVLFSVVIHSLYLRF
jgi:hypothetical protein